MISIADGSVCIQTSSESVAATPSWFGEVVLLTAHLRKHGALNKINEQVRFARRRFGHYDVIDFLAVLFGYVINGERTLEEFYERLQPFAVPFMALFERDRLPSRSALSRFLAALTEEPVEALRTLFLDDLLARPPPPTSKREGWWIERETPGWSLISTAHGKLLANVPYLRPMSFLRPFAGWVTSARLAIGAASAERLSGHEQRCRRRTVVSGWARLAIAGTGDIGRNCARDSPPLAGI